MKRIFVLGDLTSEEMDELLLLAANSVDNSQQIDLFSMVVELYHRVEALETADYAVWRAGYVTKRGEIVKIDLDGDGNYDYATYLGGMSETSLAVGKIDGWYKVTSDGVKTHSIRRNSDGTYTLTPVEE